MCIWLENYSVPLEALALGMSIGFMIGFLLGLVKEH